MAHEYSEVPRREERSDGRVAWKYFFRQLLIASGIWTPYFSIGLIAGTPTVYIRQMRRDANSTEAVSLEMASWLTSVFGYSAVPCCLILAFCTGYIGRKKTFTIVALNQVLVAICFYLSITPMHLLLTEIMQGLTNAGTITVCVLSMVEYTSPKNRGPLMTVKTASVYWAIWAANTIGTYAPWKYISILGFINAFYSLTVFMWPESPFWLASRGKFEECRKSHRWLRGYGEESEKELQILIETQMEKRKMAVETPKKTFLKFLVEKEFYRPMILCSITSIIYLISGKQVVTLYALDVLKEMTNSESSAHKSMLIIDGVSVLSMYVGCFLCRIFKRRLMLFTFGGAAVFFLLSISLYMYLIHLAYFPQNEYISISLLIAFSVSIGVGPMILGTSIHGELIPSKYKNEATVVISLIFMCLQSILLKNSLYIMKYLHMHGMFLSYGISASIGLLILYKYLPETKDKAMHEIEEHFKY